MLFGCLFAQRIAGAAAAAFILLEQPAFDEIRDIAQRRIDGLPDAVKHGRANPHIGGEPSHLGQGERDQGGGRGRRPADSKKGGKYKGFSLTKKQVAEIAKKKFNDLNARDVEHAGRIIEGTARSMGITVVD